MSIRSNKPVSIHELGLTSDSQLKKIANDLHIKLNWIGFEEDLPIYKNGGYILNIGNSKNGTHWVSLFVKDKQLFYFDSFSVAPNNEILIWAQKNNVQALFYNNKEQFQQLNEMLCGVWCIAFLYYMQNKKGTLPERFNAFCEAI